MIRFIVTRILRLQMCFSCSKIFNNKKYECCSVICTKRYKNKVYRKRRKQTIRTQAISANYKKEIDEIYRKKPKDMTVDHIVPLHNPVVSGLHVPWNMQYLSKKANSKKGNKYEF